MAARKAAKHVTEDLPATTTLRDVLPTLQDKNWFVMRLDQAQSNGGQAFQDALERATRGDASTDSLTDLTARDPRGIGVRGGYPQINQGLPGQSQLLRMFVRFAYRRTATARLLVDTIASMVWGEWVEIQTEDEVLKAALEAVFKNPTGRRGERPLYWWIERAYRLARRDGRSLLLIGLIEGGNRNPKEKPVNVQGINGFSIVREENIQEAVIGKDPQDLETYGRVAAWKLTTNQDSVFGPKGSIIEVHADRVQPFIPSPTEDDLEKGESIVAQNINYVEMVENLIWSSAEDFFQNASPYIVVSLDKDIKLSDDEKKDAKASVAGMQQGATQRIFLRGVTVSVLRGSGTPSDPLKHWEVGLQAFAMAMGGIPVSMLTGNQTGRTSAAVEDTARMASIISKIQEQDADPALNSLIDRFIEWGVAEWGTRPEPKVKFKWNPLFEPNPSDFAQAQWNLAQARDKYRANQTPLPEELDYDGVPWPEGTEDLPAPAPLALQAGPPATPTAGELPNPQTTAAPKATPREPEKPVGDSAGLPASIVRLVKRTDARIQRALKPAYLEARKRLATTAHHDQARRGLRTKLRGDDTATEVHLAIDNPEVRQAFQDAILAVYRDGLDSGGYDALDRLNSGTVYDALQDTDFDQFRSLAKTQAATTTARLAEDVRREVADGVAQGESSTQLSARIEKAFDATKVDAMRVARTEAMRAYNRGTLDASNQAGADQWVFRAHPDADLGQKQQPCQDLNGQVFSIDDDTMMPPDSTHPNCTCWAEPYTAEAA